MTWSDRQLAMLREMGIRLWPVVGSRGAVEEAAPVDAATSGTDVAVGSEVPAMQSAEALAQAATTELLRRAPAARPAPAAPAHRVGTPGRVADEPTKHGEPVSREPGPSSPLDILSFDELAALASTCTACRLCEGRRHVVFGAGASQAQWMIVGDAPGDLEDQTGLPFGGKPGQLLDNMLAACGLDRKATAAQPDRQVFLTNALKCRPTGSSNPTAEELSRCEPYLLRQIALVKPKVVVAMGRYAVQSLLHSTEPLGKLRGRVHRAHGAPDVPVVVTFHPTYLLRNADDKARAWDDLCLAMDAARS